MYKDFNSLEGKRLIIDKVKNYFSYLGSKGSGNIYFHFAHLDSIQTDYYRGRMSGLFDADLGSIKITNGRFDHDILPEQVHF